MDSFVSDVGDETIHKCSDQPYASPKTQSHPVEKGIIRGEDALIMAEALTRLRGTPHAPHEEGPQTQVLRTTAA